MKNKTLVFKGYKPKPWQKVVHQAITQGGQRNENIYVVKSPRQIGKTMIIEQELLRHALNYPRSISICLSLTISNCRKIYKDIVSGCKDSGIIDKSNDSLLTIEFITGSSVIFLSAQQKDTLRGYTVRGGIFCIDEAAYIPSEIFDITFPYVSVNKADILMTSTPRFKQGTFYDYFMMGLSHISPKIHSFDLSLYDTSEFLSPEKKEMYRRVMPKNQFRTEILGEFIEEGGNIFSFSDSIFMPCLRENRGYFSSSEYDSLYVGIDWSNGSGGDYTVVSAMDSNGIQRGLHYDNTMPPGEQINQIVDFLTNKLDPKKIRKVYAESNSMGAVYIDVIKDKLKDQPFEVESFTTTNATKREIIESLSVDFENNQIKLMTNKEQKSELLAYSMEMTKTGLITYNAPYGLHDDFVIALALANYGRNKSLRTSDYSISFGMSGGKSIRRHYD